jgi:hypothetical protein
MQAQDLEDFLKSKEGKPLWAHEDIFMDRPTITSAEELTMLVTKTISVLAKDDVDLPERWADEGNFFPAIFLKIKNYLNL